MRLQIDTVAGAVEAWVEAGDRHARLCLRLPQAVSLRPMLERDLKGQAWERQEGCQTNMFERTPTHAFVRKFRDGPTSQAISQALATVAKAFVGLALIPTMQ